MNKINLYSNSHECMNLRDFEVLSWVHLRTRMAYEEKKMRLEAIVLMCICQGELYLYSPKDFKKDSMALLFRCNIDEMEDVRYSSQIGKFEMFFRIKQSTLQIRFRRRSAWVKTQRIIDGGSKIETKYQS